MKILHVTNRLSEGGVETFLLNLLPALKNNGFEVDLLVLDQSEVLMKDLFEQSGIKVIVGPYRSIYDLRYFWFLYCNFRQYDIIHSHLFPSQYFSAFSALIANKKIVTTEHCTENKRRRWLFRPLESLIYHIYDEIIGVSEAATANLVKWLPSLGKKTRTICNGINLENFSNVTALSKFDLNIKDDEFLIVMTARFFSQKDHDTLIRASEHLPKDVKIIFIGSGDRLEHCIDLANEINVTERCLFVGRRSDVAAILKAADLCVLSTHYEGLPVSIIEYFASGKPVIATNVDGVNEMIDKEFLVEKNNPKQLAEKIIFLKENNLLRNELALKNKNKSVNYSLDEMTIKYVSIYQNLNN